MTPLEKEIYYRGCSLEHIIFNPTNGLQEIKKILDNYDFHHITLPKKKLSFIKKQSESFLQRHYKLHRVPFFYEAKLGPLKLEMSSEKNIFRLPIILVNENNSFYGCLRETININGQQSLLYKGIELSRKITDITSLSYTHELTHTQLNHQLGLIKHYYNTEVLSIFNETLQAFETSNILLFKACITERLIELKEAIDIIINQENDIDKDTLIEASCYCLSTLKAYMLFDLYYRSNTSTRKYILTKIQQTIDGTRSLEENLQALSITDENCQDKQILTRIIPRKDKKIWP